MEKVKLSSAKLLIAGGETRIKGY